MSRSCSKSNIAAVIFFAAMTTVTGCSSRPAPEHNVLLITLDTTRADRLGCYGYGVDTSPALDAFARSGILFERAISPSAVTNTSHASIFTGLYPYNHGVRFLQDRRLAVLGQSYVTMAEVFRDSGARTAAFVSAIPASSEFGLDQGFEIFDDDFPPEYETIGQRRGDQTADLAIDWLGQVEEPFFGWVHFFDPHDVKITPNVDLSFYQPFTPLDDSGAARLRSMYDAEIRYMDLQVARVLKTLEERGLADATIVVIVGDHGDAHGEHDWWGHGKIYQEQIRVPMMIRLPDGPAGVRVGHLVSTTDLLPTVLERCGLAGRGPDTTDGTSLSSLIDNPDATAAEYAYADATNMQSYMHGGVKSLKTDKQYCVMDQRWKLIYHQIRPHESELYDLESDPGELQNLYDVNTEVRDRLLSNIMARDPMIDEISGAEHVDPDLLERLKALGYVQ